MIDVYRVGWLNTLHRAWTYLTRRELPAGFPRYRRAWEAIRYEARYTLERLIRGEWRGAKNTFNGWLAEPVPFPDEVSRCGTGWTRARAIRSLRRHGYQFPQLVGYHNGEPRYRHTTPCPDGMVDGWGGPAHADPQAAHSWYECPHPYHLAYSRP